MLSPFQTHVRSHDNLNDLCCTSFDSVVQEEHNDTILEALSLLCDTLLALKRLVLLWKLYISLSCEKLLAKASFDIS